MFKYIKNNLRYLAIKVNHHIGFIDRHIEERFLAYFHKKKLQIVKNFLMIFTTDHPGVNTQIIRNKLETEADRVCNFTDRAVLRANIKKAKYTFWSTAIGNTALVIAISGFHTPVSFITPFISPIFTYVAAIFSITALYNQRVKGAMNSTIKTYETELEKINSHSLKSTEQKATANSECIPISTDIVIDFIPSTIQIRALLDKKIMISFASPTNDDEKHGLTAQAIDSRQILNATAVTTLALADLRMKEPIWKNHQDEFIVDEDIHVLASGPTWHY